MNTSENALPAWCHAFRALIEEIVAESEDAKE